MSPRNRGNGSRRIRGRSYGPPQPSISSAPVENSHEREKPKCRRIALSSVLKVVQEPRNARRAACPRCCPCLAALWLFAERPEEAPCRNESEALLGRFRAHADGSCKPTRRAEAPGVAAGQCWCVSYGTQSEPHCPGRWKLTLTEGGANRRGGHVFGGAPAVSGWSPRIGCS
jgi:hypothetical protein